MPAPGSVDESEVVQPGGSGTGQPGGILPPLTPGTSNALLVSRAKSASGRPLAVFGPQTGYFSPQILWEGDLHAPARGGKQGIDARGAAFPGVNLYIQLGRGRDYAWSATSAGQDNVDTFALELCNRRGPALSDYRGYRYRGQCLAFERLERRNQWVPNAADQTPPGSETLVTNRTKLGLEIARARLRDGTPVAYVQLRSTYMHEADSAAGFVDFNDPAKMGTAAGFQEAAHKIGFTFNWFYASGGDIAYFNSGNNPQRPTGPDPNFPVRACPDDSNPCRYEWVGWDPDSWVSEYTPFAEHPQAVNPDFLTSWNNKQAPEYRAADDNFAFGSVHRSEPLDDRIGAGTTRSKLVDAMEDAATVDLRGDKVLGYALQVLGDQAGTELEEPIRKLSAWRADGAHRRDKHPKDRHYEHRDAIKIMDAWWPRWIEAQFKPALGDDLYSRLMRMIDLDDEPNANGTHVGSSYIAGWYGYAEKDLRSILGEPVTGGYSRQYCGDGDNDGSSTVAACRDSLRSSLQDAVQAAANEGELYGDETCESDNDPNFEDPQLCFDAIEHSAVGAITMPLINWQNRPTFQQVVEVGAR
jgi:acyl-homoserine lactone acylase PvdQ